MLKTILSISGKPGLYKLISQGKNMLIVESLVDKKRFPAYGNEKIISLGDIAMYTDADEVPLKDVLLSMKKKENGAAVALDVKKASVKELQAKKLRKKRLLPNNLFRIPTSGFCFSYSHLSLFRMHSPCFPGRRVL